MRNIVIFIILLNFSSFCFASEQKKAQQEIDGFSLVQYDDAGGKKWELNGKSAEVKEDRVSIHEISALAFEKETNLKLKSEEGEFDRKQNIVHLETNVRVKTTDGAMLTTDSLNWDAEAKNVFTDAAVNIKRPDFEINGKGAVYNLENETAELKKDVTANIVSPETGILRNTPRILSGQAEYGIRATVITCDGPLEVNYRKNRATFQNNVKVEDIEGNIFADRIDVYFNPATRRIKCVVARGNVKIMNGESITYSEKAIYLVDEGRVVLPKKPRLVIQNESPKQ